MNDMPICRCGHSRNRHRGRDTACAAPTCDCQKYDPKSESLTILRKEVGREPEVQTIPHHLAAFQAAVGGYLELHPLEGTKRLALVMNEDGRSLGLPPNLYFSGGSAGPTFVVGDVFVVALQNSDFASLTDAEIEEARAILSEHALHKEGGMLPSGET